MDVAAYMAERIPLVDRAIAMRLDALSRGADAIPAPLAGAMQHLLFPGGKRLRPVMALAAAEAVGGPAESALPLGVAVELIHTYSLIHDDLPCMDDDDLRRGRPTVHRAYDEATAVLAGDALLTEAFAALADAAAPPAEAARRIQVLALLARCAGAQGLVGGQVDDLAFEAARGTEGSDARGTEPSDTRGTEPSDTRGTQLSEAGGTDPSGEGTGARLLASIHARKTAALFRAAIEGGATLAGATPPQRASLERFARDVGIGFQIADDVLDADSGEAASILRLQGIDDAKHGAEALLDRALGEIEGWGESAGPLRALARFAIRRER